MKQVAYFHPALRILHWFMAAAIVAMLFIGIAMVSTISSKHALLVAIHKPLGLMILVLVVVRLWLRFYTSVPSLPASIPAWQRLIAHLSHWALYIMMFLQPLIGWAMQSAAGYPITLGGGVVLPPIVPVNNDWFAILRPLHSLVALMLFATVMLHLAAALFHALVLRDGVFDSMAGTGRRRQ
ncbi:cytochrome b [Enterobacter ludwigii]|jgi:cytochrome b561|uniref:cytochrome b n=1 Tax=Enterobacter TaxID=547 RepID=UPI000358B685|nr:MULTISPECIES: cytochrome b/b6 domain-containing protein [Enterobacter]AHE73250.1 cytochrome B561 [Enterobacter ludwigii]EKS6742436.1 cytochrome b/b6 domain-containing protein [Enterobacter ludwigii]EKS7104786.1 cytochrome b/b6 domain-containing protein [Enterobacter ludwigii]EKS7110252.1 cytochrome b/b6 domain-containing protein [Enterobacter ludwigii]EKS7192493.1 cytochrome b/b6 domain-containing protein [Enterobacter ludwigii]